MAEEEPEDMDRLTVLLQEQEDEENREKNFHCDFTSPDDTQLRSIEACYCSRYQETKRSCSVQRQCYRRNLPSRP
jgi:hypothetical protein